MDLVNQLNIMYGSMLRGNVKFSMTIPEGSITKVKATQDAFSLMPPAPAILNKINVVEGKQDLDTQIICRVIIGLSDAIAIKNNFLHGIQYLSVLKHEMIKKIINETGYPDYKIFTFERPGNPDRFFNEQENCAGIEIRLYAAK